MGCTCCHAKVVSKPDHDEKPNSLSHETAKKSTSESKETTTSVSIIDQFIRDFGNEHDELTMKECVMMDMKHKVNECKVVPNATGSELMYNTKRDNPNSSRLFICSNKKDPKKIRFMFMWEVNKNLCVGCPHLPPSVKKGSPVKLFGDLTTQELKSYIPKEITEQFKHLEEKVWDEIFKDSKFVWTRNKVDDNNFKVSKTVGGEEWYWAAEETGENPPVTLTDHEALEGHFSCIVIS